MRNWSGTARRLFFAFAGLIGLYGAASWMALSSLAEVHEGLQRTRDQTEGVRLALELASAVRDQYAHQAHTIIIGDESHLGFYAAAEKKVLDLAGRVRAHTQDPEALHEVAEIEAASARLDEIFRKHIVPAVVEGRAEEVQQEHARAQVIVSEIQDLADALAGRFEGSIAAFQEHVNAVERRTFRWLLVFLLGAPLLATAVGLWVGRSVAVPVSRLREGAARLAAGDLDTRIGIDTPDEFGALARQFNAMTAAIKEHQARLVETEKLAGIGRLAAGVAHEINNPLGVILGYARLLRRKAGAPAEELQIIEEETLRCQEIVEGLLDLSRPMKGPLQQVDLRELCDEVATRLADSLQLEGVQVAIEGAARAPGSPPKLRQIVLNLIKNGAEAAGPGGRVQVRLAAREGSAELVVADSGPGIGGGRDRLFEPFYTTKPKGTGLGLAVSRAIARAHGGDLVVGDGPLGGAQFTLRLPEQRAEAS